MLKLLVPFLFLITACSTSKPIASPAATDPREYLEEVEGTRALDQVRSWNERTLKEIQGDPRYAEIEKNTREIILAKDRIPQVSYRAGFVYNFWQDEQNARGLWRRATVAEYRKSAPKWELLIDFDALAKKENENWVYKGSSCLPPKFDLCLVRLSRGGKDASVTREYSIAARGFVVGGFEVPEAKSTVSWRDENSVFVSTDFGEGTMSKSGYPLEVRLWKRGTPLASAQALYRAQPEDNGAGGYTLFTPTGQISMINRSISSVRSERFLLNENLELKKLTLPEDLIFGDFRDGKIFGILRTDLGTLKAGSVVSYNVADFAASPSLVYAPGAREAVSDISALKDSIVLTLSKNVQGSLIRGTFAGGKWKFTPIAMPANGDISVASADTFSNVAFVNYASFLIPNSLYLVERKVEKVKSLPAKFNASGSRVQQFEATSKDGTKVPYYVVGPKNMKLNGLNPTLLYGYGGFMIAQDPSYLGPMGKSFVEKGGVFVLANIRGGSEFGPQWHAGALKEKRQNAYDDFIAIAEDLIARKITSPKWLGIRGGSNGGLLTGVAFTQRPDLFGAVLCEVPLLDMLRFHKLLAGFSWVGEYGNPDLPEEAKYIRAYSPYQNLREDRKYPRIFLLTSTKDDRVHPGHARKFAAKLEEMGHPFLYFENIEGGHGAAANLEQRAKFYALEMTYLWRQLGSGAGN